MTRTRRLSAAMILYAVIGCALVQCVPLLAQDLTADLAAAVKLFDDRSYSQAIPKLEALTKSAPDLEPVWYYLGVAKFRTGDYEGALEALRKARDLNPGRPGSSFYIGQIYESTEAYEQAIRAYQDELRLREGRHVGEVFNALGRAYYWAGYFQDALEVLQQALDEDENYVEAIFNMGRAQYELDEYERALKRFDEASKILKEWDRLVARLEEITKKEERRTLTPQEQRGKQQTQEDLAEKYGRASEFAIDLGLRPTLNLCAGDAADANKEWARARTSYRHALEPAEGGNPADPLPQTKIALALLHEAQSQFYDRSLLFQPVRIVDRAIETVQEALGYSDTFAPAYECLGEIYLFQAATYISDPERNITSHSYQDALAQFGLALDNDPEYVDALLNRARAQVASGGAQDAIQDLQTAIDLQPNNPDLYAELAAAHVLSEDYEQAVKDAQTALLLDTDHEDAHNAAGLAYYYLGELGLASEHFTRAIAADPTEHQSYTNLGNTFFQLGSWHRARAQYEKALERIPKPALANTAYQRSYLYYLIACTNHYTGAYDKEVEALNQALALDAAYLDALLQLGRAYVELRQFRAAEQVLRNALDISTGPEMDANIYVLMGGLFEREGKPHEALTAYGQALAVQSDNVEAKEALERLQAG